MSTEAEHSAEGVRHDFTATPEIVRYWRDMAKRLQDENERLRERLGIPARRLDPDAPAPRTYRAEHSDGGQDA